jgi:benzoyl-CoA reductase/2-hydroxyglutaryl-CoA dehydratase subunit BcrC/BadD/HgdB
MVKDLHIMDLPQMKSGPGRALLKEEYARFVTRLEEKSGRKVTVESLKQGIATVNAKRQAVKRLAELRKADPAPISGLDALLVNQIFFYDDPARFTASVNALCDELEERVKKGEGVLPKGTPRLVISGCPMAVPNWKVPFIVETSGAVIVAEESCVGERGTRWLTETQGSTLPEMLDAITERYFNIDCAVFTPNPSRVDHVGDMFGRYGARGVIHYSLQFCQPYLVESGPVEAALEGSGIPVLRLETDYSQEDMGQLKTRIEAFVERIHQG